MVIIPIFTYKNITDMIIYLFSFPNGKHYVGRTKNSFKQRCTEHKNRIGKKHHPLYHAFEKYGWDTVKKQVIYEGTTHEDLVEKELEYILKFDSINNGYNLTLNTEIGGDNWQGREGTIEYVQFVEKMKIINSGTNNGMYGRLHSKEARQLQKDKAKGRFSLPWFIERYGEEEGTIMYINRCENRKGQLTGDKNTSYKAIDLQGFKEDVLSGMSKVDLCKKYKLGSTAFRGRLQDAFGHTSLYKVRGRV